MNQNLAHCILHAATVNNKCFLLQDPCALATPCLTDAVHVFRQETGQHPFDALQTALLESHQPHFFQLRGEVELHSGSTTSVYTTSVYTKYNHILAGPNHF